jgi:hypothetical protein
MGFVQHISAPKKERRGRKKAFWYTVIYRSIRTSSCVALWYIPKEFVTSITPLLTVPNNAPIESKKLNPINEREKGQ